MCVHTKVLTSGCSCCLQAPLRTSGFLQNVTPGPPRIRESVDSLCRDGANTPIVCVHWKTISTREHSCSKLFWPPSYPTPAFLYPKIHPKWLKHISTLTDRQQLSRRFVHHVLLLLNLRKGFFQTAYVRNG